MRPHILVLAAAAALVSLWSAPLAAQSPAVSPDATLTAPGWSLTPSLTYTGAWDDNALVKGRGDDVVSDYTTAINPRGELAFNSRRGRFSAAYDGSFVIYRDLNALNSFDQRGMVSATRQMTRRVGVFGRGSFMSVPTTELMALSGVPFVRLGSQLLDTGTGIEAALTKRTSLTTAYSFQWVDFERDPLIGFDLLGGHSHGGSVGLKHSLSPRTALTASYNLQRATVLDGGTFNVQHGDGGAEYELTPSSRIYGALGFARLGLSQFSRPRTGLAWRAGYLHAFHPTVITVTYSRSFVPSYSFGGTTRNEELTSRVQLPLGRRAYAHSGVSWRRDEPLAIGELRLRSLWIEGAVGYAVQPWMQLEAFYSASRQSIRRAGGQMERNRIGFQVITVKPVRIR
jgi:hypothetical protein